MAETRSSARRTVRPVLTERYGQVVLRVPDISQLVDRLLGRPDLYERVHRDTVERDRAQAASDPPPSVPRS